MNKIEVENGVLVITKPYMGNEHIREKILEVSVRELLEAIMPYVREANNNVQQ